MLVLSLLAACGGGEAPSEAPSESPAPEGNDSSLVIRGQMYYLARIALAPDSTAIVELRDGSAPSGALLAVAAEPLDGRQVPIPFELEVAAEALAGIESPVFRAGIVSGRSELRVTGALAMEQRSGQVDLGEVRIRPVSEVGFGAPYLCGERSVVLGGLGNEHYMSLQDQVFLLRSEVSASGARYVAVDDSNTSIWTKGNEATVTLAGEELPPCSQLTEPELPFVARGQEPGWRLNIDSQAIDLRADYGEQHINFPRVEPSISAAGFRYETQTEEHRLTVLIDRQICADTMVDLVYPYRVRYTLDGSAELGCGGDPREVLMGEEWQIESIGGESIVSGTQPTIAFFSEDGQDRFGGRASCNRFMGEFQVVGEGLRFTPGASTLMACIGEEQALQERRLLTLLGEVYGFGIDQEGKLRLRTGGGDIVARR
jgi:heat shock protein HslJ